MFLNLHVEGRANYLKRKLFIGIIVLGVLIFLSACSNESSHGEKEKIINSSDRLTGSELETYNFKILEDYYKDRKYNYAFDRYHQYYDTFISNETRKKADKIFNDTIRQMINDESQYTLLKSLITHNNYPFHLETLSKDLQEKVNQIVKQEDENKEGIEDNDKLKNYIKSVLFLIDEEE
jgi:antitoxin component of RelBE/YafQ-DinJ toxin-antitoxin module